MKILSCYIENFGCLSQETVTFGDGLFVRMRQNGEGKSTLLAFLRAMLYGMESLSASDKRFKERLHYRPFGGGTYGGSLTVEYKGEIYRIERVFDGKSSTKDTLTVYDCHGVQTDALGIVPGETVFGLDEEAFARTAFMTAEDVDASVPQSIGQRMCGFAFGAPSDNDFDRADALLERACKDLHSERKSRGEYTGDIPDKKRYLYGKQNEYTNLKNKESALAEKQDALTRARDDLTAARKKRDEIRKTETALAHFRLYDEHMSRAKEAKDTVQRLTLQYPHGIPSEEEVEAYRRACDSISRIDGASATLAQSEQEDRDREQALSLRFESGAPTDDDIKKAADALKTYDAACRRLAQIEATSELSEQDRRIVERFDARPIDKRTLNDLRQRKRHMLDLQAELDKLDETPPPHKSFTDAAVVTAFALSALCLVLGAVLCALLLPLGIGLLICAVLSSAIGVFRVGSAKKRIRRALDDREKAARALDESIRAEYADYASLLARYGYLDPSIGLNLLEGDAERYFALRGAAEKRAEDKLTAEDEREQSRAFLSALFERYRTPIEGDMTKAYYDLKRAKEDFTFFTQKRVISLDKARKNEEERKKHSAFKAALLKKYAQTEESFSAELFHADREALNVAQKAAREEQEAAEKCRIDHALPSERPMAYDGDPSVLDADIDARESTVLELKKEISDIEIDLEALGDTAAEIVRAEESLQMMNEVHSCMQAARRELGYARRELLDRYVEPIRRSYLAYAEQISPILCEGMSMSSELDCSFEWHGALHSASHLSMGERSAMALCLRLALLDGMYGEEKPPLFLDDPFMALDEEHTASTLALLSSLAKDRQIIYLTCHESRNPLRLQET